MPLPRTLNPIARPAIVPTNPQCYIDGLSCRFETAPLRPLGRTRATFNRDRFLFCARRGAIAPLVFYPPRSLAPTQLLSVFMVNRNLLRDLYDVEELDHEVAAAMADASSQSMAVATIALNENSIVEGRIIRIDDEFVLVDVGYKSEGQI